MEYNKYNKEKKSQKKKNPKQIPHKITRQWYYYNYIEYVPETRGNI